MKKIYLATKILIAFISLQILTACPDMGTGVEYNYTIINESGKTVKIVPYSNGEIITSKSVTLQNGEKLNHIEPQKGHLSGYSMFQFVDVPNISHIAIIFNNEKKSLYSLYTSSCATCPKISGEIYNDDLRSPFNNLYNDTPIETYIINATDYQNATLCNGNCD